MSALVQVIDATKRYGGNAALEPTSLSIDRGLTTVLIGPSGCGKSTLMRLIIGLIEPDSGRITFDDEPLTKDKVELLRRRIGYVIQEGGLFPHLNAEANVLLMARHLQRRGQLPSSKLDGLKPSSLEGPGFDIGTVEGMRSRLSELCSLTRFREDLLSRYPIELSGGQRQRVSLMRALMLSPELLLLDEPLGALDPLVRSALQKDLKDIFSRLKQTTLLVTHDLAEAAYLGDRIVLMNEGQIVQQGSIADLRERPANEFVSEFINAQRSLVSI